MSDRWYDINNQIQLQKAPSNRRYEIINPFDLPSTDKHSAHFMGPREPPRRFERSTLPSLLPQPTADALATPRQEPSVEPRNPQDPS